MSTPNEFPWSVTGTQRPDATFFDGRGIRDTFHMRTSMEPDSSQCPDIVISYDESRVMVDPDDAVTKSIEMFTGLVRMVAFRSDVRHQVRRFDVGTTSLALYESLDTMRADVATAVRDLVAEILRSRRPAAESPVSVQFMADAEAGLALSSEIRAMLRTPISFGPNPNDHE
ncbi:hypothetical protein ACIO14_24825 [Nocardia fluminea]|uniref:hypothetical protein n=1 Tax=Nocardia fluminea TaxID=134984 RepID=UPI0037F2F766